MRKARSSSISAGTREMLHQDAGISLYPQAAKWRSDSSWDGMPSLASPFPCSVQHPLSKSLPPTCSNWILNARLLTLPHRTRSSLLSRSNVLLLLRHAVAQLRFVYPSKAAP